jgi:hypothetical protein
MFYILYFVEYINVLRIPKLNSVYGIAKWVFLLAAKILPEFGFLV